MSDVRLDLDPSKDAQTVTRAGEVIRDPIDGLQVRYATTIPDERGSICEMFNPAWGFTEEPVVYVYETTIRPGKVKGWVVHREQDDRLFFSRGTAKVVLYDARLGSPTNGAINELVIGEHNRALVRIPKGVFHALQNVASGDVTFVNMPTRPYRHEDPDKYRLPLDTEQIPYRFAGPLGW